MKWSLLLALIPALSASAQTSAVAPPKEGKQPVVGTIVAPKDKDKGIKLSARAGRSDALYHKGEAVTFDIKLLSDGIPLLTGEVDWVMTKDGLPLNQSGKAPVKDGAAKVTGKLDEPGFLQVRVVYRETPKSAPITASGGAGIDPTEIKPSMPVPDDFDAFWDGQKKKLAAIPINAKIEKVESTSKKVEAFDIKADSVGSQVSGYFARPVDAKPKSLPVILTVHGAGVRSSSLGGATSWANQGYLAMDMNAHGSPNGKPDQFYKELADKELKDYRFVGRESRETCYFLGMYLRLIRGIDLLTSQPEWDGKTVIVFGGSQGGAQAFAAAGLDSRVTFFCAAVPAMSDHTGMVANRIAGWPKLVPVGADGKPDAKVLEASRYFDDVNMATRTKARGAYVSTGFIDTTCPPTSVYAAYNVLKMPKQIKNDIESAHPYPTETTLAMMEAVHKHVRDLKAQ
ncbi:MAG: acetyl xylan esterase [Verrucomicrobiaceae bacterium]|nr:acetyl xylan esterase [Verrucomicrobiaceae bacterium]